MKHITVLSFGGSIIDPDSVDTEFLSRYVTAMDAHLDAFPD